MPPKKIPPMFIQVQDLLDTVTTKDEMKSFLNQILDFVKAARLDMSNKVEANKADMTAETKRLGDEMAKLEKRLRGFVESKNKDLTTEIEEARRDLYTEIGYVESLIKTYDDTELRAMMEQFKSEIPQMPEPFDPTELNEKIEKQAKEIEDLKKRPTGTGGGVRRVFQPYLDRFRGDGSTKTFYLSREPLRTDSIEVWCTDFPIVLDPNADFTVTGKNLTLTDEVNAPSEGAILVIKFYA